MPARRKVSQALIAEKLNLSQGLVSRILNGRRRHIDPETYRRVQDYAAEVGYKPKGMDLNGEGNLTGTRQVGLILRSGMQLATQSNFFSHVQQGLHDALATRRFTTVLLGTEDTIDPLHPPHLPEWITIYGSPSPSFVEALRPQVTRIAAVGAISRGICHSVATNERQALFLLVKHLHQLGHRQLGWIGGDFDYVPHQHRYAAFQEACAHFGLTLIPKNCKIADAHARSREGRELALEFAQQAEAEDFPTAIVAYNGTMARGAINAILRIGWRVPQDLSIVAVDATRVCEEDTPTITSASATPELLGREVAELLLREDVLFERGLVHLEVPSQIYARESSAAPRTHPLQALTVTASPS